MKPETKQILLDVELGMAKNRMIGQKREIIALHNSEWKRKEGFFTKQNEMDSMERQLDEYLKEYEKALDASLSHKKQPL